MTADITAPGDASRTSFLASYDVVLFDCDGVPLDSGVELLLVARYSLVWEAMDARLGTLGDRAIEDLDQLY